MSKQEYRRVLPRDLFNEGNLLTQYGRLWILLEEHRGHQARIREESVNRFETALNESTGGTTISNLTFEVAGKVYYLERGMNSREKWGLMVSGCQDDEDFEEISVFDEEGNFSEDMKRLIGIDR